MATMTSSPSNEGARPSSPPTTRRRSSVTSLDESTKASEPAVVSPGGSTAKPRKSSSLPPETVEYLKAWMMSPEHVAHPYPTEQEKAKIMADTGIELKQLTNWFVNNRKRFWKPRVEARLQQQAAAQAQAAQNVAAAAAAAAVAGNVTTYTPLFAAAPTAAAPAHMVLQPAVLPFVTIQAPAPAATAATTSNPATPAAPTPTSLPSAPVTPQATTNEAPIAIAPIVAQEQTVALPQVPESEDRRPSVTAVPSSWASAVVVHSTDCTSAMVSDVSTASSVSGNESDATHRDDDVEESAVFDDIDEETNTVTRSETVDVHILRPSPFSDQDSSTAGDADALKPTLKDVTILHNVPSDRIIKSYTSCHISYSFARDLMSDRKKVQSRRDAEIVRLKKHYLRRFFSQPSPSSTASTSTSSAEDMTLDGQQKRMAAEALFLCSSSLPPSPMKRRKVTNCEETTASQEYLQDEAATLASMAAAREVYSRPSPQTWRNACYNARHGYDSALPSLEEAARLFGYVDARTPKI